jgi:hypothetical protein
MPSTNQKSDKKRGKDIEIEIERERERSHYKTLKQDIEKLTKFCSNWRPCALFIMIRIFLFSDFVEVG